MKKIFILLTVLLAFSGTSTLSCAQDSFMIIEDMDNYVGVGGAALPDYVGSNNYTAGAAPFARITLPNSKRYFQLNFTELVFNMLDHPFLRFGPVLNYRFGRDDDVEDSHVKLMSEIDDTIEAGFFMGFDWKFDGDRRHRLVADAVALFDVGGVYEGAIGNFSARYWRPLGEMFDGVLGVGFQIADINYMNTYFGVSASDSFLSGLPIYQPSGGFSSFRIFPGVVTHLSPHWHLATGFRYERLLGDAKNSPVVSTVGSPDQWIAGMGVAYSW
jgi:outer membrane protein